MIEYWKHFKYTMIHKFWVMRYCFEFGLYWQGITHDWNKFLPSQFIPYARNFFGERTREVKTSFKYAWLDHQNTNKHHWHYYVYIDGDGELKPLDIPINYIFEMVCDWRAAGKAKGTSDGSWIGALQYFQENGDKMILSEPTRKKVQFILDTEGNL